MKMYCNRRTLILIISTVILFEVGLAWLAQSYLDYQITRANSVDPARVIQLLEERAPKLDLEQYYKVVEP